MNLKNLKVEELNISEALAIDGGSLPKWVKGGIVGYIVSELISNWDDVEKGFIDGYNSGHK